MTDPINIATGKKAKKVKAIEYPSRQERLEGINKEFAVIQRGSQILIMRKLNGKITFLSRKDFLLLMENQIIYAGAGEPPLKLGTAWLGWPGRHSYDDIYFEPCGSVMTGRYNLWQGFGVKELKEQTAGKFDIFIDHIRSNICQGNPEYFNWVMAWLANMFQNPVRKPGTALVLRGRMGIGKGLFATHLGKLFGLHYMHITQPSQLTGKFNGHLSDKILMFIDESWWSDEKYGAGILRGLITEPSVSIEMKGRDAIMMPLYAQFIIAANEDFVVPVGMTDERRFTVLDAGENCRGDKKYFNEMEEELTNVRITDKGEREIIDKTLPENAGYAALLYYLRNYEYDKALPRTILHTAALLDQKLHSIPTHVAWWKSCLIHGTIEKTISGADTENWPDKKIPTSLFYKSYLDYCETVKARQILGDTWLMRKLNGWVNLSKKRIKFEDTYYMIEDLEKSRATFCSKIGHDILWEME